MRITFLTQYFEPEPAPPYGLPLARALARRGHEIEVITAFPNYPQGRLYPGYKVRLWQRETMSGIRIVRVPLYPSHDRNLVRRAANHLTFSTSVAVLGPLLAQRSDAIYVNLHPPSIGVAAAFFRKAWGVPVLCHVGDMWPESAVESGLLGTGRAKPFVHHALEACCQWVYRRCDAFAVNSPALAGLISKRGVDPAKVHVIYNWADDELFRPVRRDDGLARELGMEGRFNVVYAGNLGPFQSLDTAIRAATLVRDVAEIQFVFVGTGTEESRLRMLAKEMGADNVRFLGHQAKAQMPALHALADALLIHLRDIPFIRAAIPSKTQVSLACARPIIMAAAGEGADLVSRAHAGLTVPPEQPDLLAHAVRQLHSMTRDERERIGARGREYYLREMCLETGSNRMAELLVGLAKTSHHVASSDFVS